MDTLFQDLRYALRQFVRRPGFTAIAVVSLGLAIGGNSLIYGMLDGFVFRPFPYPQPDRLVAVGVADAARTLNAGFTTVRNVGSGNFDDVGLKQAVERRIVPGPRIVPATYAIGAGHCDVTELPPSVKVIGYSGVADGADAIRFKVRELRKYGAEVIKFCGTGGVFSKTDSVGGQQYTLAEMQAQMSAVQA